MKKLHAPFDRAKPLARSNTPKPRIFFVYLTQMARRASNRRQQTALQASFADAAALDSVRADITEAEMEENRRRAGLPDNWKDLPLRFGPGGLQGFADALNAAKATNSPLILDFTPPAEKPQQPHWAKVVKSVEREFIRRNMCGVCLMASFLAARFIPGAVMKFGYVVVRYSQGRLQAVPHTWLELKITDKRDPIKIDIGTRVFKHWHQALDPEDTIENVAYYLNRVDVPAGAQWPEDIGDDGDEEMLHQAVILHQQDPEAYFHSAPAHCKWIQDFRP